MHMLRQQDVVAISESCKLLPGSSEDLSWVGTYGINGAVVTSDLSYGSEVVDVPHLQHAAPAGAQQHGPARDVC